MKHRKINKQCGYNLSVLRLSQRKEGERNKLTSDFQVFPIRVPLDWSTSTHCTLKQEGNKIK